MVEVKLNNSNNTNPFYGLRNCLKLYQDSGVTISESLLNSCYNEIKDNKEQKEMFFSLLFSIGDITARQHNIFGKKKIDSGGNANREGFYTIFMWLKTNHKDQFMKFLKAGLFNEYTCFDLLFRSRVKTSNKKVVQVYDIFSDEKYRKELAEYIYSIINGKNPFNKLLVAKFLTPPRMSKRSKHTKMLDETRKVMNNKALFLVELSKLMGWEYTYATHYANFIGYRIWRKEYNQELESVLFSSGKIKDFDEISFIEWFGKLPSQARFRVKNRVLYSRIEDGLHPKYNTKFKNWIQKWEDNKEVKQKEQRVLEEKIRQGQGTEEDKVKLAKVKKEAKVNIGATNFNDLFKDICENRIDKLKLESFINKVNLPYNNLVILDASGSMNGRPYNFASFLASVCLIKNPDDDGRNLLGFFGRDIKLHSYIDEKRNRPNSILNGVSSTQVHSPFVNPELSFYENYSNISAFCISKFDGGVTNIESIPEYFNRQMQNNPFLIDQLRNYPVWTIVTDGNFNSMYSPEASMNSFMRKCENYFGFSPYIIAIDIAGGWGFSSNSARIDRFSGIDNFMYIPSNPAQIEQILTNFKDMDIFDVYTPLQSLYRSNRYELVRNNTL